MYCSHILLSSVQAELVTVSARLAEKEAETVKLGEENERLAEQLASSVERPGMARGNTILTVLSSL